MDPADRKTPPAPFPAAKVARVPPPVAPGVPAIAPAEQSEPIAVPKSVKKWMPMARTVGPPLVALILAVADGRTGKHEATQKTDVAYQTLAPSTNEHRREIKELKDVQAKMAVTLELHTRLLLASQPGFTPAGTPAPAPAPIAAASAPAARRKKVKHAAPVADPTLVKAVQANAAKTLQEIQKRVQVPVAAPLPPSIPAQAPPPPIPTEPPKQSQ